MNDCAPEMLQQSERRFRSVFNQQFHHMAILSLDGVVLEVNELPLRVGNTTREEVIGRPFWETVWWQGLPDMQQNWRMRIAEAARTDGPVFSVDSYRAGDGTIRRVDTAITAVRDEKGEAEFIIVQGVDITERIEAEKALRESEAWFRQLANSMPHIVWTACQDGYCDYYNDRWYQLTGLSEDENGEQSWEKIMHPDDIPKYRKCWIKNVRNGEPYQIEVRLRDHQTGMYCWYLARALPVRDQHATIVKWFGTGTDIHEQKQTAERLREVEERLRIMIESVKDYAIFSFDPSLNVMSWNSGAEHMFGYAEAEIMGKSIAVLFTPEDRADHIPEYEKNKAQTSGRAEDERWHIRKDQSRFFASGIVTPMLDQQKQIIGFIKVARDITERKVMEQNLRDAVKKAEEASIAKSDFLANMSHEIRTPMNSVIGTTELLLNTDLTEEQQDYAMIIHQGGEILLSLINDILDFSKIEAGEMKIAPAPFRVNSLLDEIIQLFKSRADENHVRLIKQHAPEIPFMVLGDCKRLRQIIFNLVGNAIKFTRNGSVTLRTKVMHQSSDVVTIRFEVDDTGIGIASDKLKTIFGKFIQADNFTNKKYGGTGLGLAISRQLTELMGGAIKVRSTLGKGSCFYVEIPFILASPSDIPRDFQPIPKTVIEDTGAPFKITARFNARVLLVEDYLPNQKVAKGILEKLGCSVDIAEDGEQALEKLKDSHYDLIFMDCQMPEMDGYEATRMIRSNPELTDHIIIAMTANALEGDREKVIAAGMDDYISKPIKVVELQAILQHYATT